MKHFKRPIAAKLLLILLISLLPMVGAILMYQARDTYHFTTKNAGELIRPSVQITSLMDKDPTETQPQWWLVYYTPNVCDQDCQDTLEYFKTIQASLTQDQHRINRMVLTNGNPQLPGTASYQINQPLPTQLPLQGNGTGIWLMDPLGNIILSYDQKDNRLLLDLRYLLKVSRIG